MEGSLNARRAARRLPTSRAARATIGYRRARIPERVAPRQCPPPFPDAHSGYPEAMPTSTPPSEDRVFDLLRKTGLEPDEAFTLFAGIRDMASANLIARFEAKLDAMTDTMRAEIGSVRGELSVQRWLMGIGFAALVAAAIAQLFRG